MYRCVCVYIYVCCNTYIHICTKEKPICQYSSIVYYTSINIVLLFTTHMYPPPSHEEEDTYTLSSYCSIVYYTIVHNICVPYGGNISMLRPLTKGSVEFEA